VENELDDDFNLEEAHDFAKVMGKDNGVFQLAKSGELKKCSLV
jgi:hypothetical protein